jgi:hypothetical protein
VQETTVSDANAAAVKRWRFIAFPRYRWLSLISSVRMPPLPLMVEAGMTP